MILQHKEWTLSSVDNKLFVIKLTDPEEGAERIWLTLEQLEGLRSFLNGLGNFAEVTK